MTSWGRRCAKARTGTRKKRNPEAGGKQPPSSLDPDASFAFLPEQPSEREQKAMEPDNPPENLDKGALVRREPGELERPTASSELLECGPIERGAEVARYWLFRLEWWLDARGRLRQWLRFNLRLAIAAAIPAFLLVPLVNHVLGQLAAGTGKVAEIARNLSEVPAGIRTGLLAVLAIGAVLFLKFVLR